MNCEETIRTIGASKASKYSGFYLPLQYQFDQVTVPIVTAGKSPIHMYPLTEPEPCALRMAHEATPLFGEL